MSSDTYSAIDIRFFLLLHGMNTKKVNIVTSLKQKPWLPPYLDLNIKKRAATIDPFKRNSYKMLNSSFYRRKIKNVRN